MALSNHHTHTHFSDGKAAPESYIDYAIRKGFALLGFSEHSPLPFDNPFSFKTQRREEYINLLAQLKQHHEGTIQLFCGMEADYVPGKSGSFSGLRKDYRLDYIIGSVHLVSAGGGMPLWFTDGPDYRTYDEGLHNLFGGDIRRAVGQYFRQVNEMIETEHFEVLGHLDKIRMHNRDRFFTEDEDWYQQLVMETLQLVQERDLIVEINTRGIYKQRSLTTYPAPQWMKQLRDMHIPVMVNSDAHLPEEIDGALDIGYRCLLQAGIGETVYFNGRGWAFQPIDAATWVK